MFHIETFIEFDEAKHLYKHRDTGEEYTSATTLLKKYKKVFNSDLIASKIAKRDKLEKAGILQEWADKAETASKHGRKVHKALEDYHRGKEYDPELESQIQKYRELGVIEDTDTILSEFLLALHPYKLAGTADIIRLEDKGYFSIFDLKTNKAIKFASPYKEQLLPPLNHLAAVELNIYALQLSLYAYMFSHMTGKRLSQIGIIHYEQVKDTFIHYPVSYLKSDIINLLTDYKKREDEVLLIKGQQTY